MLRIRWTVLGSLHSGYYQAGNVGLFSQAVFDTFHRVKSLNVQVVKLNPPMGADCKGAGVELNMIR